MINTASVLGVNANIFGGGFQKKYIESFSWGEMKNMIWQKPGMLIRTLLCC